MPHKKNTALNIFLAILIGSILLGTLSLIAYFGFFKQTALAETFTPVYCNDYSFTCCKEKKDFEQTVTLTRTQAVKCPDNANKCQILSHNSGGSLYVGSQNCGVKRVASRLFFEAWVCDDERIYPRTFPITIKAGEYAYFERTATLTYNAFTNKLFFCGRAGCDTGIPVLGADGCTFQTNKDIYDPKTGSLLKESIGTISYTVNNEECVLSYQQGDRHICGNLEEQCTQNSDCIGHTYGNFECSGRTLQEYGCRQLKNVLPLGVQSTNGEYEFYNTPQKQGNFGTVPLSRCEITSAKQVQCCGDTDCGSDAFCDNNPSSSTAWTCRPKGTVQCTQDADCGVSQQCNINKLEIQKSICNQLTKKCDYKKIESVECCSDSNCPSGYFCDNDRKCKESSKAKTTCPFECCEEEEKYFDRGCPKGFACGKDNKCITEGEACKHILQAGSVVIIPNLQCLSFFKTILWIVTILLAVFTFFEAYTFTSTRSQNPYVNWIVSLIFAVGIGLLVFLLFWWGVLIFILFSLLRWLIGALVPEKIKKRFR